ncbi:unnamed protein product [Cyclocybe aegerita]|uniref:Uncharacterized protein n=1 Tax=Cyclocybe aegerita TaxID=1973307 RepID=A0A8S0W8L6_CYCAE|nr:unnamed protein product [Cyclocybe aegerita]
MAVSDLSAFLLDSSLIDYTTTVTREALQSAPDSAIHEQTKKRAAHALEFFLSILDPSIDEEKKQLEIFKSYHAALNDPSLASTAVQGLSIPQGNTPKIKKVLNLTPAQHVLSLPDTLDAIFAHIPLLTKSDRDTFYSAALTSHPFHNAVQLNLWRRPRDLDTVEQQVRFAFGTAISGAISDSLGLYVQRLRIRIIKGGWNFRLVEKIASLTPGVVDLTLHWGDSDDGEEPVTASTVTSLHKILSSLPNLRHLYLAKFAYTPSVEGDLAIPADAEIPFTKLETLRLYDFHWYWRPISTGLGAPLKTLDIGYGTSVEPDEIVALSTKLPSLTTIRIGSGLVEVRHIRKILENIPSLEHIDITNYNDVDDEYVAAVIPLFAVLQDLKELSFNGAIGSLQVELLAGASAPLQEVSLKLKGGDEVLGALEMLLKEKHTTLKIVAIAFEGDAPRPTDKIVEALARIPLLESVLIDFDSSHQLSSSSVDALLKQCPNLVLTDHLETLVQGNALYEKEYKAKFEKARDEAIKESEESVLGN